MTTLMRNGQDRRLGRPAYGPREARTREIGWDPIRGLHQGQRPLRLHRDGASLHAKTGRIHGCTRTLRKKSDLLLQRGHRPYMARFCRGRPGRACPLCPGISDVNLFRYRKRVIDLNAEVSDGAFDFGVPEQELHGS